EMASLYRSLGVALPKYQVFTPGAALEAGILLCAPGCRRASWFSRLRRARTAYISGWAVDAGAAARFGCDTCFPLSDHADYGDLLEYASRSGAETVYPVHGFAAPF